MKSSASAWRAASIDLVLAGVGAAVADVVADRAVEERGVLGHHADLLAERLLGDRGDVLAVDQDAPALEVVEAEEQVDERRLARAGAADDADLLARPDRRARSPRSRRPRGRSGSVTSSKRISPRATTSGGAPGLSVIASGRAMVLMPSSTVPMFSKRPATSHRIHCDMARMRMTSAIATAIAPSVTTDLLPGIDGDRRRWRRGAANCRRAADGELRHQPHLAMHGAMNSSIASRA